MLKNKPVLIFITILVAVVIIAISIVVSVYNKNKPIIPDNAIEAVSSNDIIKIKKAYETEGKKEEFIKLCESIELAVANKFLDGTVTNDKELSEAINKINNVLDTDDWSYLGIQASSYWMGDWKLNEKGAVTFSFQSEDMKPAWTQDETVKKYIK